MMDGHIVQPIAKALALLSEAEGLLHAVQNAEGYGKPHNRDISYAWNATYKARESVQSLLRGDE